ncbi:MAG: 3-hydroxyacyl-CoA dehydrogenase family protein [Bacillota bacterium]
MKVDDIKNISVIGAGTMGHQIAVLCALAGYQTICMSRSETRLEKVRQFVQKYLPERVAKGKLTGEQAELARANLSFTTNLEEAAQEADFVIEAAVETLAVKRELFKKLDQVCSAHAVLTTTSSYIVSSRIADVTARPGRVCNMHFFNPALVMKCVEVVKGPHTLEETAAVTMELARRLKKEPVLLHKEVYGFLVNRIFRALMQEAFFLLDTEVASVEDIDNSVVSALGHPMGPFRLMDLTGIDLAYRVRMERYRETMDPADKPSPAIVARYARGEWGRKSGKGFYEYER